MKVIRSERYFGSILKYIMESLESNSKDLGSVEILEGVGGGYIYSEKKESRSPDFRCPEVSISTSLRVTNMFINLSVDSWFLMCSTIIVKVVKSTFKSSGNV